MQGPWSSYDWGTNYDEIFEAPGRPRKHARALVEALERMTPGVLDDRRRKAELAMLNLGITFTVYSASAGVERISPFDLVPRIIPAGEWRAIESGLKQRVIALNEFVQDVYNEQRIVEAGVIPPEVVSGRRTISRPSAASRRRTVPGFTSAAAMHAWVEVFQPEVGWIGVDATTGRLADERYVVVGYGRDYDDVRPVRGVILGHSVQTHSARLTISVMAPQAGQQQQ